MSLCCFFPFLDFFWWETVLLLLMSTNINANEVQYWIAESQVGMIVLQ